MYNCIKCEDAKRLCTMNCSGQCREDRVKCDDCVTCYDCKGGLKFQAVLRASIGTEVVGTLMFRKCLTRLEAEQAVEYAGSNVTAIELRNVLTKLYPVAIITTHVQQIEGV